MASINLAKLRDEPFLYDVNFSPSFLMEGIEEELRLDAAEGQVAFRMIGDEIVAEGEIRGAAHAPCARCLDPVDVSITAPVRLYWWPRDRAREESKIADVDPAEPDYGLYEGNSLDPDEDLREILLVEIPDVIFCGQECKGLCPGCGANLNIEKCACPGGPSGEEPEDREPAWKEKLKKLNLPPE